MASLDDFCKSENVIIKEGHSQQVKEQSEFLRNIVNDESINHVMEIGFNAGHSAELFLSSKKNLDLVSFDIGNHKSVNLCKQFIDQTYPDRHTLIIGNSLDTVPEYYQKHNKKFDLIFLDGGHYYKFAKGDIVNCKNLAHNKTIIIMDDTVNNNNWVKYWNEGCNQAWKEAKEWNIVKEIGSIDFSSGRGQSWGHYIL